jgi:hypothetical protein
MAANVWATFVRLLDMEHAISLAAGRDRTAGGWWVSRATRCKHTLLTKPECHCPACLSEQIAAHAPATQQGPGQGAVAH